METVYKAELLEKLSRTDLIPVIKRLAVLVGYWIRDSESKKYALVNEDAFNVAMDTLSKAPSSSNVKTSEVVPLIEFIMKRYDQEEDKRKEAAESRVRDVEEKMKMLEIQGKEDEETSERRGNRASK